MTTYSFSEFEFDPQRGLWRSGTKIPLEPLTSDLLHFLLRNDGRIVSREEFTEELWQGRVVSDAALSTQVRALRRALGDDAKKQQFIKTHPRRGFSFAATVQDSERAPVGTQTLASGGSVDGRPHRGGGLRLAVRRWRFALAGLVIAALLIALAADRLFPPRAPAAKGISIAVLPFDNLSGDPSLDYLAEAFTEDLITDLSRIRDAFVISRSTSFTYRGKDVDAVTVARELGVRYILEGSLRVDETEARINAQLIDGRNDSHLWSDRYAHDRADLFDVQNAVTGQIASVLRAELRLAEDRRQDPEIDREAWDFALRGNVLLYNHNSVSDYTKAYALLTRATKLDPTISSAWGGLSFIHFAASVGHIPGVSNAASARSSLETALKAVQADPMNAEPYWLVGAGYARTGSPERGMSACETAIELNPNMDCGYVCAGLVHLARDEPLEAVPLFEQALRLNPLFRPFVKRRYLGVALLQSGEYEAAIDTLNRALAQAPEDMMSTLALAAALALDGRVAEAEATLLGYNEATGSQPPSIGALRESVGWLGPRMERMFDGLRVAGVGDG